MWTNRKKHCRLQVFKADSTSQQCVQFLITYNTQCTISALSFISWLILHTFLYILFTLVNNFIFTANITKISQQSSQYKSAELICRSGRTLAEDERPKVFFSIPQGTLLWIPFFVDWIHIFFCQAISPKQQEVGIQLLWTSNRKSYVICRLLNGTNFNDLELP